jgi:hypothetical protein
MPFNPAAILDSIGEDKWLNRFHSLNVIYTEKFLPLWPHTYIDQHILLHAVQGHFCDLQHAKNFHDIPLADQHKKAAFTIKWLTKTRPIQLKPGTNPSVADLLANEMFALMAGMIFLKSDVRKISKHLLRSILYTLHHRPIDAEVISALMYTLECALDKTDP